MFVDCYSSILSEYIKGPRYLDKITIFYKITQKNPEASETAL